MDAILDPRGRIVRCTPRRWTLRWEGPCGVRVYRKVHVGRGALAEWRWLHELARLGFRVPAPAFVAAAAGRSVVGSLGVDGRPLDTWLAEAAGTPEEAGRLGAAVEAVAPLARRLHDHGLFHRDLYLGHLFLCPDAAEPVLLDVGRVLRPLVRRRRWVVKDLAGLLSSCPLQVPDEAVERFLDTYLGGGSAACRRRLAGQVARKARRIRERRPRYE